MDKAGGREEGGWGGGGADERKKLIKFRLWHDQFSPTLPPLKHYCWHYPVHQCVNLPSNQRAKGESSRCACAEGLNNTRYATLRCIIHHHARQLTDRQIQTNAKQIMQATGQQHHASVKWPMILWKRAHPEGFQCVTTAPLTHHQLCSSSLKTWIPSTT
jgi:hypothetical protein